MFEIDTEDETKELIDSEGETLGESRGGFRRIGLQVGWRRGVVVVEPG